MYPTYAAYKLTLDDAAAKVIQCSQDPIDMRLKYSLCNTTKYSKWGPCPVNATCQSFNANPNAKTINAYHEFEVNVSDDGDDDATFYDEFELRAENDWYFCGVSTPIVTNGLQAGPDDGLKLTTYPAMIPVLILGPPSGESTWNIKFTILFEPKHAIDKENAIVAIGYHVAVEVCGPKGVPW